jgi:excisionase family DNA binding protein
MDPAPQSTQRASTEPTANLPLLIDSREVARLLGIGRTKAFELMARDELPVVHIGRCVRVSRAALNAWIAEQLGLLVLEANVPRQGSLR